MKKLAIIAALILTVAAIAAAQETAAPAAAPTENKYEVQGKFSFTYPQGWQKFARPNAADQFEWLIMPGNTDTFFSPAATHSEVALAKFVDNAAKANASDTRVLLSKAEFTTAAGEKGYKLRWKRTTASSREFLVDQYFFMAKQNTQLLFTGVTLFAEADKYEPVFDGNVKSLVIEK